MSKKNKITEEEVKKIIEQHSGTISLNSIADSDDYLGFGTEVVVLLPHSV